MMQKPATARKRDKHLRRIGAGVIAMTLVASGCSKGPNEVETGPTQSVNRSTDSSSGDSDNDELLESFITDSKPAAFKPIEPSSGSDSVTCRSGVSLVVPQGFTLEEEDSGDGQVRQYLLDDAIEVGSTAASFVASGDQTQEDLDAEVQAMAFSGRSSALLEGADDIRGAQITWPTADYAYHLSWTQKVENAAGEAGDYQVIVLYLGSKEHKLTAMGVAWVPADNVGEHIPSKAVQTMRFC